MITETKTTWRTVRLGKVVEIIDGDRGKNYPGNGELLKSGYSVFLNTKNVPGTKFDFSNAQFISEKRNLLLRNGELERGDFVLTTRGTIGNVAHYGEDIPYDHIRINSGMVVLRPKLDIIGVRFLNLFLIGQIFKNQTTTLQSGSAQPQLPIRDLQRFEIKLPPLTEQTKISNVLWPFDEKVENNNRVIKTLEEIVQTISKEWFATFRFPGHEKAESVDSKFGKIPKGWEVKKFSDIANLNRGVSYSSKEIRATNGGLPMINLANFLRGGGFNADGVKYYTGEYKASHLVKPGQIVIAMTDLTSNREVIGHPARIPEDLNEAVISLDVCSVSTDDLYVEFLYSLMLRKSFAKLMAGSASGTNVSHLSKTSIEEYELIIPDKGVLFRFNELIRPIFTQQIHLAAENRKLLAMRDLLLPRLMSGEIRV